MRGANQAPFLLGALLLGGVLLAGVAHAQGAAAEGEKLAADRAMGNCYACHTMKGSDVASNVGPELKGMKARFPDRKALYDIIYDEETRNPQTVMPAFGKNLILSQHDISAIVDFLYTM
ncbi:MAG: sulfur oxidation c-type cytochrome SoxX [Rhodospirillales bacterium]|nr:sulfur oxidation c-type cytochrome SoxX [Rhodospirillales bacterium]MDE2575005.1 sulfur oxidation c-type cytochrome SoxX [Rhodospirillales bacterium]